MTAIFIQSKVLTNKYTKIVMHFLRAIIYIRRELTRFPWRKYHNKTHKVALKIITPRTDNEKC